jgi:hypothetical protein
MAATGLKKWFDENWIDVKTEEKCGRSGKEKKKRPYPACRPAKVAGRISKKEAAKKTGPKSVKWSVTASGKKRQPPKRKKASATKKA